MDMLEACRVLEVDPRAADDEIRAAWRRMAQRYHPDRNPGPDANSRMQMINVAWGVLQQTTKEERMRRVAWEEELAERARSRAQAQSQAQAQADTASAAPAPQPDRPRSAQDGRDSEVPRAPAGTQAPSAPRQTAGRRPTMPYAFGWDGIVLWLRSIHPWFANVASAIKAILWPDFIHVFSLGSHVYLDEGDRRIRRFNFGFIALEMLVVASAFGAAVGSRFGEAGHGALLGGVCALLLGGTFTQLRRAWFAYSVFVCGCWAWLLGGIFGFGDALLTAVVSIVAFIFTMRAHRAAQYVFLSTR